MVELINDKEAISGLSAEEIQRKDEFDAIMSKLANLMETTLSEYNGRNPENPMALVMLGGSKISKDNVVSGTISGGSLGIARFALEHELMTKENQKIVEPFVRQVVKSICAAMNE